MENIGAGGFLIESLKIVAKENDISEISLCVTKSNNATKMIQSNIISTTTLIIKHVLSTAISESESQKGAEEIIELIDGNSSKHNKSRLLIDVRDYSFETLEARRIWSIQFKTNEAIQEKIDLVAIVGSPNEAFNTEKLWMETTRLKFFEKEQDAELWLLKFR